jgi:hypothetical protein
LVSRDLAVPAVPSARSIAGHLPTTTSRQYRPAGYIEREASPSVIERQEERAPTRRYARLRLADGGAVESCRTGSSGCERWDGHRQVGLSASRIAGCLVPSRCAMVLCREQVGIVGHDPPAVGLLPENCERVAGPMEGQTIGWRHRDVDVGAHPCPGTRNLELFDLTALADDLESASPWCTHNPDPHDSDDGEADIAGTWSGRVQGAASNCFAERLPARGGRIRRSLAPVNRRGFIPGRASGCPNGAHAPPIWTGAGGLPFVPSDWPNGLICATADSSRSPRQ